MRENRVETLRGLERFSTLVSLEIPQLSNNKILEFWTSPLSCHLSGRRARVTLFSRDISMTREEGFHLKVSPPENHLKRGNC